MQAVDSSLQSWTERCVDLEAGVQDLIRSLERYGTSLDSDPERLAVLQDGCRCSSDLNVAMVRIWRV